MSPWKISELDDAIYLKPESESVHIFFTFSLTPETEINGAKRNLAEFKKSMTRKHASWSSRGWHAQTSWQHSPVDNGGQSSQDKWKKPAPLAKWTEVSHPVEELGMLARDKWGSWVDSCKEGLKRESKVFVMAEEFASMGITDEHARATNMPGLTQLRKIREKEEAAKELLEEVQD